MATQYLDKDGNYLGVLPYGSDSCIAWFFGDDGDYGLLLGDKDIFGEGPENDVLKRVLENAEKRHDYVVRRDGIYVFYSERLATQVLRECNEALLAMHEDWPDWAVTAAENGWKPPKGWKP